MTTQVLGLVTHNETTYTNTQYEANLTADYFSSFFTTEDHHNIPT